MISEEFEKSLKRDFLVESLEMIESCESAFLQLEKEPTNSQLIDKIFRLAHTIKGSGLAAGFSNLAKFAHVFENLLSQIRLGKISIDSEMMDILLESMDVLKLFINILSNNFEGDLDTSKTSQKINQQLDGFLEKSEKKAVSSLKKEEKRRKVIICDDEADIIAIHTKSLEPLNLEVIPAYDGSEALKLFQKHGCDLIITDLKMPKMDGFEFVTKVKEIDKMVPIIFCSGYSDRKDIMNMLKIGVYDFLEKPFRSNEIFLAASRGLKLKNIQETIENLVKLNFKA
ncbi:MAG: response regulator, partial [Silvanigrellaceae bacterium]|nr:response regulator [Silvanigrellaceae bacterium]